MTIQHKNGLSWFEFESYAGHPLHQGIFMRRGGVSPEPWRSLNLSDINGDTRENVIENRKRIFGCFDLPVPSIFDVWQIHSNTIICTDSPRPLDKDHEKADAIFTDNPDITLFMRFADCVPLFFYDPKKRVIGVAHAGRIGTLNRIAEDCVKRMNTQYGSQPEDIMAGIGPSIGPDHYEVREDVIEHARTCFKELDGLVFRAKDGSTRLDLWEANKRILQESGVEKIELAGICTACNTMDWFSHRAERGSTGRFGALMAMKKDTDD
jgi:YfiH family protein